MRSVFVILLVDFCCGQVKILYKALIHALTYRYIKQTSGHLEKVSIKVE